MLYEERLCEQLEQLVKDFDPSKHELVFLGLPSNIDAKKNNVRFQNTKEVLKVLPYCDSYMVSKACAKNLHKNYLPIKFVNNVQLSYVLEKSKTDSFLVVPNIFMDGTKYGMFLSTLSPNNQLIFNNEYMQVKQQLANPANLPNANLEKIFKESPLSMHPDFNFLYAQYLVACKRYAEANDVFENSLKVYLANNCVVNHETQFLKEFIRVNKYTQEIPNELASSCLSSRLSFSFRR